MIEKIIAGLLAGLPFLKAKPYCLYLWDPLLRSWKNQNPSGHSARRCKKARKVLLRLGCLPGDLVIMPKGIDPPVLKEA